MDEIKLEPCPFCGNENVRLMSNETEDGSPCCVNSDDELEAKYCYIHCYGCDMDFMPDSDIAKEVVEAWNKRSDEQNDDDLISRKALREEVKKYRDGNFSNNNSTRYALSYAIGLINNQPTAFEIMRKPERGNENGQE